jgi:asparagine synthase (glutamine-hydrolysing)
MKLAPIHLDELYLAQMLVSSPGYLGARTSHSTIRHVPPAHSLTVTPSRVDARRYWQLENVPELHLPRREDYVAGLRDVLDRAVRERLPRSGTLAAMLSGGLDSGSVSVTAAGALHDRSERLTAYTSVPLSDPSSYVGDNFGDEFHFASRTADAAGNIDIHRIEARGLSPLQAIRSGIDICLEPLRGAAGLFWILDLHKTVAHDGHATLFTGQMGNGGISWTGDIFSQPLRVQTRHAGIRPVLGHCGRTVLPKNVLSFFRRRRPPDRANTAIAPEFARRIRPLLEARPKFPWQASPHLARQQRVRLFRPTSLSGAIQAEIAAAYGLAVTDPTADPRVVSFCLSVPDRIFIDPESGIDRWLIREAMKGRLPDEVRLNRRRGRQSADLVPRLRACADEVESALDDVANGPTAAYVSPLRLRQAWDKVKTEDDRESFRCAAAVLARGIMAGLFVNGLGKSW